MSEADDTEGSETATDMGDGVALAAPNGKLHHSFGLAPQSFNDGVPDETDIGGGSSAADPPLIRG